MTQGLTICYTPTKQDYVRASRALAINSVGFRLLAVMIAGILLISMVMILSLASVSAGWRNAALILFFISVFYILYFFVLIPLQLGRAYRSKAYLRMPREFTFSELHVLMKIGTDSVELHWEDLRKVINASQYFLLIFHAGERIYPFLPKRAFSGKVTQESFLKMLAEKSVRVI